VYSRNAEDLRREQAQVKAIRDAEIAKGQPFLKAVEEAKKLAASEGRPFEETKLKIRWVKPYHEAPEQWAVLIGGFRSDEEARKALNVVRKLPPPKDVSLLDPIVSEVVQQDRSIRTEGSYLNPFSNALVVPNPAVAKAVADEKYKLEPFLVKINSTGKYTLLQAKKPWTLQVKAFTTPMKVIGKGGSEDSVFERTIANFAGSKSMLDITAEQAEKLTESLRDTTLSQEVALQNPDLKAKPFESFVLHHRTGSIVCVGQFDAPNDPELIRMQVILQGMTFKVKTGDGREQVQRMFDIVSPMPVPKY